VERASGAESRARPVPAHQPALLDHPVDHPDDPTGPVWIRLDRRGLRREQARSVWSRPDRRSAPGYGSGVRSPSWGGLDCPWAADQTARSWTASRSRSGCLTGVPWRLLSPARMVRHRWLSTTGRRGSGPSTRPSPTRRRRRGFAMSPTRGPAMAAPHASRAGPWPTAPPTPPRSLRTSARIVATPLVPSAVAPMRWLAPRCWADRMLACTTVAAVGPFGAQDLDFLEGWAARSMRSSGAALAGPAELQAYLERQAASFAERQAASFAEITGEQVAVALGISSRRSM
jgi:hypothetical protein